MLEKFALWRCNVFGWHPIKYREYIGFEGKIFDVRCGRCGFVGIEDSQGCLF